jgi:hypothetical protein
MDGSSLKILKRYSSHSDNAYPYVSGVAGMAILGRCLPMCARGHRLPLSCTKETFQEAKSARGARVLARLVQRVVGRFRKLHGDPRHQGHITDTSFSS